MKAGIISDIKRFAVHDGDGVRTTVFLKGCPLKCIWCHNPEGISFRPQMGFYKNKCAGCGTCMSVCENKAHSMVENIHFFDYEKCVNCGKCVEDCPREALKQYGRQVTVKELMPVLLEDREFYESSGGGVTLSGGECLMQAEFCEELLRELKEYKIHTAVDTCGLVSQEALDRVIPYTDVFLYDIKAMDEDVHIRCTGQSNSRIVNNLKYIDEKGSKIEIRIPYVPEYNSSQIDKIADFLADIKNIVKIRILPYHNYAGSKYEALNMKNTLPEKIPQPGEIQAAITAVQSKVKVKVM